MKKDILKTIGIVFLIVLGFTSCDQWIDTDLNIDPDAPADVPMNLMLPAIQMDMGFNMAGNDMVRTTNIWMQQFDGVERQSYTQARYQLLPADVNNLWNSFYPGVFMNAKVMIDKAELTEGKESPHNAGVAKTIVAATLGIATDVFGDMPFEEALKGDENMLTPAFDSQEKLYGTINAWLDAAIQDLGSADNKVDVGGDVIYGGDVAKWKKAAYSIKARHALQLSEVNGSGAYTAALAAAANGFASNADNFEVPWETNNKNPIFQFMEQRGDIRMGGTLVDYMNEMEDPRLSEYVMEDGNGEYTGSAIGSQNSNASEPGDFIANATAPSIIMSYSELKFIEAECYFMTGKSTEAIAALEEAVKASCERVTGAFDVDWYAGKIKNQELTHELIMKQKWVATIGSNQAYSDWRRTGLPAIALHPDGVINNMPARFPYSQNEIDYNGANVPSVTLSDKVWWDK